MAIFAPAASAQTRSFDVPAQDASTGIPEFARQADIQILADEAAVRGKRTAAVQGNYTIDVALDLLLAGTDLAVASNDGKTITLRAAPRKQSSLAVPASERAETPIVRRASPVAMTANEPSGLEEVVVTARRREEKLQSVPIAITAFTSADIRARSITSSQDLQQFVPSLNVSISTQRDTASYTIRGQGYTLGAGPGVVSYFAEIPIPPLYYPTGLQPAAGGPGLYYDLENLQVLKGPQGTLFGRNTTGGALLFEPKRPTNKLEGYYQQTIGNYNDLEEQGAINAPIIDDVLMVRLAVDRASRDGFTKNVVDGRDLDNRDYWAGRLGITFRPVDWFENYLLLTSLYSDTNGTGTSLLAINPAAEPVPALRPALIAAFAAQQARGPRETALDAYIMMKYWVYGITDIARVDISDTLYIKNIASYYETKTAQGQDQDGGPLALVNQQPAIGTWSGDYSFATEELQLQGKSLADALNWVVGGYLEFDHPIGFGYQTSIQFGAPTRQIGFENQRSQAAYVQGTYDLGSLASALDGLKLTGGYRYTWDFRSDYTFFFNPNTRACTQKAGQFVPNCAFAGDENFSAGTWTVGLDYQITPSTLLYVTARTGYKAGGFNLTQAGTGNFLFKPEHVTDVEIGIKSDWSVFDMPVRTDADLFHDDYSNIQRTVGFVNPATGLIGSATLNAATATIEGVEFEGTVKPIDRVEISASYSYNHALYNKFISAGQDISNLPFPFVSKNKYSATVRYDLPIDGSLGTVSASATYSWQSNFWAAATLVRIPDGYIGNYGLLNLRLDWNDIAGYPLDASFFMTNATDQVYRIDTFSIITSLGYNQAFYGEPRMWGFQLRYRFGGSREHETETTAFTPPPVERPAPAPQAAHSYLVFFDFDKSDLTPEAVRIIDEAAANAGPARVTQITVTGHTDTVGSDAYNMRLSRRRAESVAAELEKQGIPSSEVAIIAKGKRDLLVRTGDGVREPQNRRVQIVYGNSPIS
ncbi:MAG TPA: TonB-dependent receptor [Alphaproteobacteria bacterium]|nr:TonB-dependent receptor [Alphaproteobacteria bacterium]